MLQVNQFSASQNYNSKLGFGVIKTPKAVVPTAIKAGEPTTKAPSKLKALLSKFIENYVVTPDPYDTVSFQNLRTH